MKNTRWIPLLFSSVLLICCERPNQPENKISHAEEECGRCKPCPWHAGDIDDKGRLVVFVAAGSYRTLETDHALVFRNVGDLVRPVTRYDFSSRDSGFETFDNIDSLVKRVRELPKPRIIDFYVTCGAPPYNGIPQPEIDRFFAEMKAVEVELREIRPDGMGNLICTCPCTNCK